MVYAGAACSGCLTILALSGQRCTWTTAVIAYAATAEKIERCSLDALFCLLASWNTPAYSLARKYEIRLALWLQTALESCIASASQSLRFVMDS